MYRLASKSKDLTGYDAFKYLENVQQEINRLFNNFSLAPFSKQTAAQETWTPTVDVCDTKEKVIVRAELPGIKKDDIEINIYDNKVMIASWREQLGIIIESAEIADVMKKTFELAWAEAKRLSAEMK